MASYAGIVVDKAKAAGAKRVDSTSQEQGSAPTDYRKRPSRSTRRRRGPTYKRSIRVTSQQENSREARLQFRYCLSQWNSSANCAVWDRSKGSTVRESSDAAGAVWVGYTCFGSIHSETEHLEWHKGRTHTGGPPTVDLLQLSTRSGSEYLNSSASLCRLCIERWSPPPGPLLCG